MGKRGERTVRGTAKDSTRAAARPWRRFSMERCRMQIRVIAAPISRLAPGNDAGCLTL